jgi:antitoxin component YwqK of YwqJK toxin-antitoxin module
MKGIVGLLCIVFALPSVFAQLNFTDKQGRKQGNWQKTYPKSSALEFKGAFNGDKEARSEAFFYHENGELMTYGVYRNMKKDSVWLNFGPSGRISFKESYKNDILDGAKVVYFVSEDLNNKSSKISSMSNYKNGQLDGELKEYFDFGGTKTIGQYTADKKVGIWQEYHPNGQKMAFTRYKNGAKHGWCMAFDESGKEVSKVYFFYGKQKTGKDLEFLMKQMKEKGVNPNE